MKADPERPEQIAEQIVQSGYGYEQIKEAIAAAIHAERAQTARLRAALIAIVEDLEARWDMNSPQTNPGIRCNVQKAKNALREAAQVNAS